MKRSKHELGLFRGIGKFIPSAERTLPELPLRELAELDVVKKGTHAVEEAVCKKLEKKELVFKSAGRWTTTWKGDAVLKQLVTP